jgi:hypothetical protein
MGEGTKRVSNSEDLGFVDRETLRLWRVVNVVGWSIGALLVGSAVGFLANLLFVDFLDSLGTFDPFLFSPAGEAFQVAATAVAAGTAIGAVVGSRVYRYPRAVTAVVVLIHTLASPFAATIPRVSGSAWITSAIMLLHFPVAIYVAHDLYLRRRRPKRRDS